MRVLPLGVLVALLLLAPGCGENGSVTPQQQIEKTAQLINMGASSVTAIGLVAVKAEDADKVATMLKDVLGTSVLPILNGDESGIGAGLEKILSLEAFNDPKLAKAKAILETAIPLLKAKLPADLLDKATGKVPADVLAYTKAFFTGVNDGVNAYLGSRGGVDYKKLRDTLSK